MYKSKQSEKAIAVLHGLQEPMRALNEPGGKSRSMLGFYADRANRCLSASERAEIEKAKAALDARASKPAK